MIRKNSSFDARDKTMKVHLEKFTAQPSQETAAMLKNYVQQNYENISVLAAVRAHENGLNQQQMREFKKHLN